MKRNNKYLRTFMLGLQNAMEYRINFLFSLLSTVFPVIIQCFLWTAIYGSTSGARVFSYTYTQMITYTVLAGVVTKLISAGFEYEIASEIKEGGLSKYIVRPVNYFLYKISSFMGQKALQLGIMLVITTVILFALNRYFGLDIVFTRILLFFISIVFSLVLNFLIAYCVSMSSFWLSEAGAMLFIVSLLVTIMSGGIFPLEIYGKTLMGLFKFLPFQYTIYYPINVLNGRLDAYAVLQGIFMQNLWIVLLYMLSRILWGLGLKKYIAAGG